VPYSPNGIIDIIDLLYISMLLHTCHHGIRKAEVVYCNPLKEVVSEILSEITIMFSFAASNK